MNYWAYSDGFSYWGMALMRNGEEPRKVSRMAHKAGGIAVWSEYTAR